MASTFFYWWISCSFLSSSSSISPGFRCSVAQRNAYFEAGTLDAIGAVVGLDLASVHLYECLAEVESVYRFLRCEDRCCCFPGQNGRRERLVFSSFSPMPVSCTLMMAFFSSLPMMTVIFPPSKVYFMALESRLEITLSKLMRSIHTFNLPLSL